jgi:hypothetical protein
MAVNPSQDIISKQEFLIRKQFMSTIAIYVTGLPDPLLYQPDEVVPMKSLADKLRVRYLRKYRNIKRRSVIDFNLPTHYLPASEIAVGDWLLFPRRTNLPPVDLTPEQLYVAGFWLAEGHHLKESKKGTSTFGQPVGICITNTDRTYLDKAQPVLHNWFPNSASHIRAHQQKKYWRTKYVLEFRSKGAAAYFPPTFGAYASGKFIGASLYDRSGLLPLVCGFLDGDGCQFRNGRRKGKVVMSSTSLRLAYQLRQILLDEGVWATLQYTDHPNPKHKRTYWLTVPLAYVHMLTGATKVTDPGVGRTNHLAIPTPEGFYARVKGVVRSISDIPAQT